MKASELRIGNLVNYNGLVETVTSDHLINDEYYDGLKGCLPIPLTKEWLLKFDIHKDYIFDNEYKREIDGYLLYIEDIASCNVVNWDKPIKYVHEAQNLYFALTGNELEIKE